MHQRRSEFLYENLFLVQILCPASTNILAYTTYPLESETLKKLGDTGRHYFR